MQTQIVRRRAIVRTTSAPAPAPAPAPAQEQETVAAPVRRHSLGPRRVNNRVDKLVDAEQRIKTALLKIKEADEAIDRAQEEKEALLAQIEANMRDNRMSYVEAAGYEATMSEKFTRQQKTVDPKKFRAKVGNDVFWSCIKVSVTEAAQHLGDKEILAISDVVPAASLGSQLTVQEKKKKK